ncbi:TPA: LOW QUALITY PROTEIN: hypothetical protein N0F65_000808, partial [Lagenidium giganteum]
PPKISRFEYLDGLEFYNCSLEEWSDEAALTTATHPVVTYMVFVFVDFPDNGTLPAVVVADVVHRLVPAAWQRFRIIDGRHSLHQASNTETFTREVCAAHFAMRAATATVMPVPTDDFLGDDKERGTSISFGLRVSSHCLSVSWLLVLALHTVNRLYLGGMGALYWYITTPTMMSYIPTLALLPPSAMLSIAFLCGFLSACHGLTIAHMLVVVCQSRQCRFDREPDHQPPRQHRRRRHHSSHDGIPGLLWSCVQGVKTLCGHHGVCGVENARFETTFFLRELIEIAMQTYQTYYLSIYVATEWINRLAVGAMFINCISTPLVQYYVSKHLHRVADSNADEKVALSRLLCLTCDVVLDFCNAVIIPFCVFLPYWRAFIVENHDFDQSFNYNDVWFMRAVRENQQILIVSTLDFISTMAPHSENQQILIVSTLDFISTMAPHVSIFLSLQTISHLLYPINQRGRPRRTGKLFFVQHRVHARPNIHLPTRLLKRNVWTRFGHAFFVVWGTGVVLCHLSAFRTPTLSGCKLPSRPWFGDSARVSCVVFELNCYRRGTNGSENTLSLVLEQLRPDALGFLILSHCPALSVPPVLSSFPSLYGLEFYNCSFTDWPDSAALTEHHHPMLNFLSFYHVNFTNNGTLPTVLFRDDIPFSLQDVELSRTNLRELHSDLTAYWKGLTMFYAEKSLLTEIPPGLVTPQLQYLSLVGNYITKCPPEVVAAASSGLLTLGLSSNPLVALPDVTEWSRNLDELDLEHTSLQDMPAWVDAGSSEVAATASPSSCSYGAVHCVSITTARSTVPPSLPRLVVWICERGMVWCPRQ